MRQAFVLAYIRTVEVFTIDIVALRTSIFLKAFGTFATLMFAQARGWPYVLTFWSIADFCVLFGNHQVRSWHKPMHTFVNADIRLIRSIVAAPSSTLHQSLRDIGCFGKIRLTCSTPGTALR